MFGLLKALGVVKAAAAVTVLTAATTFAATQVVLPAASSGGQSHAAAGGAAALATQHPALAAPDAAAAAAAGKDVASLQARLLANQDRLLETLQDVLARLQADPNVNQHAVAALENVIKRIESGDTGLSRASQAVAGSQPKGPSGTAPSLPPQAQATLPPQALDHPTATDHPGRP
ncbi:MAG TPA: hypothetical protein VF763_06375 [Candidatus Limnocylindrales bacterium]